MFVIATGSSLLLSVNIETNRIGLLMSSFSALSNAQGTAYTQSLSSKSKKKK